MLVHHLVVASDACLGNDAVDVFECMLLLGKRLEHIGDDTRNVHSRGNVPERFLFAHRPDDDLADAENVLLIILISDRVIPDIAERIVADIALHIDKVEMPDLVAVRPQQRCSLAVQRTLGVGYDHIGIRLHNVRLDIGTGLSSSRRADHKDVIVDAGLPCIIADERILRQDT